MYYEINVSLNGQHFFATANRSIQTFPDLKAKLPVFLEKFPKSEGYEVTVSRWENTGRDINIKVVLRKDSRGIDD